MVKESKSCKSILSLLFCVILFSSNISVIAQETGQNQGNSGVSKQTESQVPITDVQSKLFHGEVQMNSDSSNTFTGESKTIKSGTNVDLTVSTVIGSDVSFEGDQFFAEVTDDVVVDKGVVIPMGTLAHGTITEVKQERRLGRDGFVTIKFDYLVTPDGREIPVEASMSTKSSPLKSFAKVALTDAGYTLAGGALGGLLALKVGGLGMAVASHGYTIAGGAALGGTIGAAGSLARKGKSLIINPGDQIKLKLSSDIALPVIKDSSLLEQDVNLDGLAVNIFDVKYEKDPFGSMNTITLGLDIVNKSNKSFTFFDVALVNESGGTFYPSPFADTSMWFQKITANSKLNGYLSFSVDNPRQKHYLVFYDKYNRKQLAKISLKNAIKKLEETNPKFKKKKS